MTENLVTIASFRDLYDAQLAKIRLESAGLEWFFADEATVHADWLYSNAIGGIKLQVRKADVQRALDVLARDSIDEDFAEKAIQEEVESSVCPRCGSENIAYYSRPEAAVTLFLLLAIIPCAITISYVFWFLAILPLLLPEAKWGCEDCRHTWREKQKDTPPSPVRENAAAEKLHDSGAVSESEDCCPKCGSEEIRYCRYNPRATFASFLLLRAVIPFPVRKWECSQCGHRWKKR